MAKELVPSLSFLADDAGAGAALNGSVALEKSAYFADKALRVRVPGYSIPASWTAWVVVQEPPAATIHT